MTPMHVFDIRRSNSVTELWKRIEKGSPMFQASPNVPESQVCSSSMWDFDVNTIGLNHGEEAHPDSRGETVSSSNLSDLHSRWVEVCNPPRLPPKEALVGGSQNYGNQVTSPAVTFTQHSSSGSGNGTPALHSKEAVAVGPSSSITAEGKRQVRHISHLDLLVI